MRIGTRLFVSFLAVVCLCLYYPLNRVTETISTFYREGVEDTLADQANILAAVVEEEMQNGHFSPDQWQEVFSRVYTRPLAARIYKLTKNYVDAHVYITDAQGIVLYNSENPETIGQDYSQWRDVFLTLRGEYGARATRRDTKEGGGSTLYVAAPIHRDGVIAGVLTVAKPTTNIHYFMEGAHRSIVQNGIFSVIAAGVLCLLVSFWLTRPIKRLTVYAQAVRDGKPCRFPALDKSEIGEMGRAIAQMQETLEGRRYVEQYVEHLTHELKSPLSAIRGAAELLNEPGMDAARQQRFIANIEGQSRRIQDIVDRMLELASLESRTAQRETAPVDMVPLARAVCMDKEPLIEARKVRLSVVLPESCIVEGDAFLLQQAMANLVHNALDFSPVEGNIAISLIQEEGQVTFAVYDEGPGLPPYAEGKVFDKFFSLQRPDTMQKSTGLGLNFVQQVARLHGGVAALENRNAMQHDSMNDAVTALGKGCRASLRIPV